MKERMYTTVVNIAYYTNVRLPSERAHGHQIASVCHALILLGHEVTLYSPYRKQSIEQNFCSYYSVSEKIHHVILGSFDFINRWWLPGPFCLWVMNFCLRRWIRSSFSSSFDVLYTRTPALLSALFLSDAPVILELHQLPRWFRARFVKQCSQCALVVCLTRAMAEELCAWGVPREKVIVEGDAVDLSRFTTPIDVDCVRQQFRLFTQRPIVGYVGRLKTLGMEKGVDLLLQAIAQDRSFFALIVGGPACDVLFYKKKAIDYGLTDEDVLFTGEVSAHCIPDMLALCDIVTMLFPDTPHYRLNMSPLKMFEYMASQKPIVTSDLPTIRDVLSEEHAFFIRPDHLDDLLRVLDLIRADGEHASSIAKQAFSLVHQHTWTERMKRILSSFSYAHFQ